MRHNDYCKVTQRYAPTTLNTDQDSAMLIDSKFFRVTDLGNLFYAFGGIPIVAEGGRLNFILLAC